MNWALYSERWTRVAAAAGFLGLTVVVLVFGGRAVAAGDGAIQAGGSVGSCTPELVNTVIPGTIDAAGSGIASAASFRYRDVNGVLHLTTATIEWSARAIVHAPGVTGARPSIGGNLDLSITTGDGEHFTFTATCIAGTGAFVDALVVYANGLTRGWPGGTSVRRSFVHFEAWIDGGNVSAYAALLDGVDCALNSGLVAVTIPYAVGSGSLSGLSSGFVYSETNCARRFGDPVPRSLAPGQG